VTDGGESSHSGHSGQSGHSGDKMAEAVAHLQAAALELIQAGRAVLDVAEDLVREPAVALLTAGAVAEALRAAQSATGGGSPADAGPGDGDAARSNGHQGGVPGPVQHVPVSDAGDVRSWRTHA